MGQTAWAEAIEKQVWGVIEGLRIAFARTRRPCYVFVVCIAGVPPYPALLIDVWG